MASGHEYRANRPNTWLLRPLLQSEDSSCQPGAVHTWARTGPIAPLSRCPLIGVDRKWLAEGQTDAIDTKETWSEPLLDQLVSALL
jgi:hypothetical protein